MVRISRWGVVVGVVPYDCLVPMLWNAFQVRAWVRDDEAAAVAAHARAERVAAAVPSVGSGKSLAIDELVLTLFKGSIDGDFDIPGGGLW